MQLTLSAFRLALDKNSVRSFDQDGRMKVSVANISKANVCPYKGNEIPGWEDLRLEPDRIYQMLRDPRELEAAAPTFNGIQLLKAHKPVDAEDHQMWDIVGTTGSEAVFDSPFLKNSLFVWTKEGIALIESKDQCELSCGYHYVPDMTPGVFGGMHYDGVMRSIKGNHVALVEEGRAGPDVVVGDSALQTKGKDEMKPTRLEYSVLMRTAAAINPLLAFDARVDYRPLVKGLNSKNFKERKPQIVEGAKKLIAGKTIAKDASVEHLAKMLDHFDGPLAEKGADESVSEPQHKAMEAAAHGESTLGIPKDVGEEFADADKGKKFGDSLRAWAKDKGIDLSEDDYSALDAMHRGDQDMDGEDEKEIEEPEAADESETDEERAEREKGEKAAAGGKDKGAKDRQAKDKQAKDKGTMDGKSGITQDEVNKLISAERKRNQEANEARAFVRPIVGELSMALDSSEGILLAAAKMMSIEDADTVHPSALKSLIKMAHDAAAAARSADQGASPFFRGGQMATDAADSSSFEKMFPGAVRIGNA